MTIGRIIFLLGAIIGVVEAAVMLGMSLLPPIENPALEAALDVTLLTILSAPFVYLWVIRPGMIEKRHEQDIQAALNEILQAAIQPLPLNDILGKILDTVLSVPWLSVEQSGAVFLMDEHGRLNMVAHRNMTAERQACGNVEAGDCLCGKAAQSQRIQFAPELSVGDEGCPVAASAHGHYKVPIVVKGETLGILSLGLKQHHMARPSEHDFLQSVAVTLAEIVDRDRIQSKIEHGDTLQAILDHAPFGIWLTDHEGRAQFVNETLCYQIGMPMDRLLASDYIGDLFDQQVRAEFSASIGRGMATDQQRTIYTNLAVPDQGERDFKITRVNIRDENDAVSGFIGIVEDITETRRLNEKIAHQATHDALTGLLNRSAFEQKLDQICQTVGPRDVSHAVCYIDLDEFKIVNDTCGHQAGDELLRQITALYSKQLRKTELVHTPQGDRLEPALARLGGDEFGLLLYNCPPEDAKKVAERLVDMTKQFRFACQGQHFNIGCSIGLVEIDHQNEGMNSVLTRADAACYLSKEKGRGRVHLYQQNDLEIQERQGAMQWVPRITQAVEENRFILCYQAIAPISETEQGDRFEVLVRYRGDDGDIIPPGAFLPAAERYSLMPMVDRWIIDSTFEALNRCYGPDSGRTLASASINLSGQTLGEEWLLEHICKHFDRGHIRPDQVCFEITETAAIANLDTAMSIIGRLKDIGCKFSLDDFGSGLSSFTYLKEMNVDYLKIDGSLVKDIATDPVGRAMVASINEIGHTMGIRTVAEWVEDDAVLAALAEIGVDYGQGYGIAEPMMFDAMDSVHR